MCFRPMLTAAALTVMPVSALAAITSPIGLDVTSCAGDSADPALLRYYPAGARSGGIEGDVLVSCTMQQHGALRACRVVDERPSGQGFGAAALAMLASSQDAPNASYTAAELAGYKEFKVKFRVNPLSISPNLTGPAHVIAPPNVVKLPAENFQANSWPVDGAPGSVYLRCAVSLSGRLNACSAFGEYPAGNRLGRHAIDLAADFRLRPLQCDGKPVDGAQVTVPFSFGGAPFMPAASDYWYVGKDNAGTEYAYIDATKIHWQMDGTRTAWINWILEGGAVTPTNGKQEYTEETFDCANRKHGLNLYVVFSADGKTISSGSRQAAELIDVPPGSLHEPVFNFVCSDPGEWSKADHYVQLGTLGPPQMDADRNYAKGRSQRLP
jgi:TonB family protein